MFENNKKEAVIPLETTAGITYLSNALDMAMGDESERKLDISINLSGVFLDSKEETYRKLSNELEPRITEKILRKGGSGMGLSRR